MSYKIADSKLNRRKPIFKFLKSIKLVPAIWEDFSSLQFWQVWRKSSLRSAVQFVVLVWRKRFENGRTQGQEITHTSRLCTIWSQAREHPYNLHEPWIGCYFTSVTTLRSAQASVPLQVPYRSVGARQGHLQSWGSLQRILFLYYCRHPLQASLPLCWHQKSGTPHLPSLPASAIKSTVNIWSQENMNDTRSRQAEKVHLQT